MEMVNMSPLPIGPLSVTFETKVQGTPLLVQVPARVAVLPMITREVTATLCTLVPLAALTYCKPPLIFRVVEGRRTLKLNCPWCPFSWLSSSTSPPPPPCSHSPCPLGEHPS